MVVVATQPDAPCTVQRRLQNHALATIRSAVEDDDLVVLSTAQQIGETRMKLHGGQVVFVSRERLDARLGLVVPDLHRLELRMMAERYAVVATSGQIGLIASWIEVQTVHALRMALHRVVGMGVADRPHLDQEGKEKRGNSDGTIERHGCEVVGVFGIELYSHDVVGMSFETLHSEIMRIPTRTI